MNIPALKRMTAVSACLLLIAMLAVVNVTAQSGASGNPKISSNSVHLMSNGTLVPSAGSTLFRSKDGVYFDYHASSLPPGNAVSAWLAVFNHPEYCATVICTPSDFANPFVDGTLFNTGGIVVGPDGKGVYGAFREVGDLTGARPGTGFGAGLTDPLAAQIHIVLRSHGPASADPAILEQQLTMFNGGCPAAGCVNLQASVHQR
jgi:hypothetical protein